MGRQACGQIISLYETEALMTKGNLNKKKATDVDTILEDSMTELTKSIRKHCEACLQARKARELGYYELPHVIEAIKAHYVVADSQKLYGENPGITSRNVSAFLEGMIVPPRDMLKAIGFEPVTVFRKIDV